MFKSRTKISNKARIKVSHTNNKLNIQARKPKHHHHTSPHHHTQSRKKYSSSPSSPSTHSDDVHTTQQQQHQQQQQQSHHPHNITPSVYVLPKTFYSPHTSTVPTTNPTTQSTSNNNTDHINHQHQQSSYHESNGIYNISRDLSTSVDALVTPESLSDVMQSYPFGDIYRNHYGTSHTNTKKNNNNGNNNDIVKSTTDESVLKFMSLPLESHSVLQPSPKRLKLSIGVSGGVDSLSCTILLSQWARKHNQYVAEFWDLMAKTIQEQHDSDGLSDSLTQKSTNTHLTNNNQIDDNKSIVENISDIHSNESNTNITKNTQNNYKKPNNYSPSTIITKLNLHDFSLNTDLLMNNIHIDMHAVTVNHGLRPEAYDETFYVKKFCEEQCFVPCDIINIHMTSHDHDDNDDVHTNLDGHTTVKPNNLDDNRNYSKQESVSHNVDNALNVKNNDNNHQQGTLNGMYFVLPSEYKPKIIKNNTRNDTNTNTIPENRRVFDKKHFIYVTNTTSLTSSPDIPTQDHQPPTESAYVPNNANNTLSNSVQDSARVLRYNSIFNHLIESGSAGYITGHHLLDQHETVLYRLLRGSGLNGLQGMDEISPVFFYQAENNNSNNNNNNTQSNNNELMGHHSSIPKKKGHRDNEIDDDNNDLTTPNNNPNHSSTQPHHRFLPVLRPFLTFTRQGLTKAFITNTKPEPTPLETITNSSKTSTHDTISDTDHIPYALNGWLEDPSNQNESYDRIKIRHFLKENIPIHYNRQSTSVHHYFTNDNTDVNGSTHQYQRLGENMIIENNNDPSPSSSETQSSFIESSPSATPSLTSTIKPKDYKNALQRFNLDTNFDTSLGLDSLELLSRQVHSIVTEFMSQHVVFNSSLRQCTITIPLQHGHESHLDDINNNTEHSSGEVDNDNNNNNNTSHSTNPTPISNNPKKSINNMMNIPLSIIDQVISRSIAIISNETMQPRHDLVEDLRIRLFKSVKPEIDSYIVNGHYDYDLVQRKHEYQLNKKSSSTTNKNKPTVLHGLQDCRVWAELIYEAVTDGNSSLDKNANVTESSDNNNIKKQFTNKHITATTTSNPNFVSVPSNHIVPSRPTHFTIHMNYGYPSPLNQNQYHKKQPSSSLNKKVHNEAILASSIYKIPIYNHSNPEQEGDGIDPMDTSNMINNISFSPNASFNVTAITNNTPVTSPQSNLSDISSPDDDIDNHEKTIPIIFSPFTKIRKDIITQLTTKVDKNYQQRLLEICDYYSYKDVKIEETNTNNDGNTDHHGQISTSTGHAGAGKYNIDTMLSALSLQYSHFNESNATLNTPHCYTRKPKLTKMTDLQQELTELNQDELESQFCHKFRKKTLLTSYSRHIENSARKISSLQPSLHLYSVYNNSNQVTSNLATSNSSSDQPSDTDTNLLVLTNDENQSNPETMLIVNYYPVKAYKCLF